MQCAILIFYEINSDTANRICMTKCDQNTKFWRRDQDISDPDDFFQLMLQKAALLMIDPHCKDCFSGSRSSPFNVNMN